MQCRVFELQLEPARVNADQAALNQFLATVDVVSTSASLVTANPSFWSVIVFYTERDSNDQQPIATSKKEAEDEPLDPTQEQVYEQLRRWRSTQASVEGVPPYVVAHNKALQEIARRSIKSRDELIEIERFGEKRVEKYGEAILEVLQSCGMTHSK